MIRNTSLHVGYVPSALLAAVALGLSAQVSADAPATELLDTITVSATRLPEPEHRSGMAISTLGRTEMDQRMTRNLGDLLQDMPGVTSAGGPRQAAMKPNVRGLGDGRVVVRLDGARQNFQASHRGQTFVDPMLLEQVEVMRGPASTLHGSGAIGGMVNVRTQSADSFLQDGEQFGTRVTAGYEDNPDGRFGAATLAGRTERSGLLGSISRQKADDFKDGSGERVPVTGHDGLTWLLKGHLELGAASRVELSRMDHEDDSLSLATADRAEGTLVDRNTRQRSTTLNVTHQPDHALVHAEMTLYHSDLRLREDAVATADQQINQVETWGVDAFNRSDFDLGQVEHTLLYGFEYYRDDQTGLENGDPRPQFADSRQDTYGAFIQDRMQLTERLGLTLGVRHDRIRQRADRDGTERISSGSTSLLARGSYALTPALSAHLGYAEAFRAPTLRELYIGGQHFPGNQYVPNPDLRPETAQNLEAGLTWVTSGSLVANDRTRARVALFRNDIDDFIDQVVDGADATTTFRNVTRARVAGLEASLEYQQPQWRARVFGSRLRGDDRDADLPLQSIPADEIGLVGALRWLDGRLETGSRFVYTAAQNRVPEGPHNRAPTPSHQLVDLFASWWPNEQLRMDLRLDNLTGETYRTHLSQINEQGRTARMQVSWRGGLR